MQTPRLVINHPDYFIECEETVAKGVATIVDAAILAGWNPEIVFAALASAVENKRLAYEEFQPKIDSAHLDPFISS